MQDENTLRCDGGVITDLQIVVLCINHKLAMYNVNNYLSQAAEHFMILYGLVWPCMAWYGLHIFLYIFFTYYQTYLSYELYCWHSFFELFISLL